MHKLLVQHGLSDVNVYFYHTQDIQYILKRMGEGEFPAHYLYGATLLPGMGIGVVWHRARIGLPRWRMMLRNSWQILKHFRSYDALFATHYRGIEPIILLRALGLFRKPVVVWHHQPVITPKSCWREWLGRLFYRGMDEMLFFSQKLVDDSLRSRKACPERMHVGHWGADLDFYDRVHRGDTARSGFISTGKEMRDMATLVEAFNATGQPIDIYLNATNGTLDYERLFRTLETRHNVRVHFQGGLVPYELSLLVDRAACVAICCMETKYTVGLTTLVEALALGLPVICSHNPQIPVDIEREGCGIAVPYRDVEGWKRAIGYMASHPDEAREMGKRGRALAERLYNNRRCAEEVAAVLRKAMSRA
ncbi:MAG: glycosyltransferase [Prevotella sp.]